MTALLALALAAAPGCPAALAAAAATPDDALADRAPALVEELEVARAGPTSALATAAADLDAAAPGTVPGRAAAFRAALERHCALAAAPQLPEASAAERAALAEVLARPELSRTHLDPWVVRRALLRLWDWIVERLGTQEAEQYASLGRALFLGAAAAAVALAWAGLRRRRRPERPPRPDEQASVPSRPRADGATATAAEEALGRGEIREAVRLSMLAALGALEHAGRVPRGRALTNDELVREVAAPTSPITSAASDLAPLARTFDRAVYGGLPVSPAEARAAVERARRVVAAAEGAA